jgi:hypothetical protein
MIPQPFTTGYVDFVRRIGVVLALACLGIAGVAQAAQKTDVVTFTNGDHLTGEIKSLEQGKLSFKTDATGTISIEWDKIATLQTIQYLQVELASGLRYLGKVPEASAAGTIHLATDDEAKGWDLKLADVVRIAAIDQGGLVARLDGYVTGGYDYQKANDQQNFSLAAGISSRNEIRRWSLDGSTTLTSRSNAPDSQRYDVTGQVRRFLADRWFYQSTGSVEGNDELGLNMRATLGGAFGRYLMQSRTQEWAAYLGVALTEEDFGTDSNRQSVEGVLGTQYSLFRFDAPEATVDASLNVYPSFTESGRVRSEGRIRSRYEIVSDLFFELSLYGSYDNRPDESANSNSDYGVVTSLGYSF